MKALDSVNERNRKQYMRKAMNAAGRVIKKEMKQRAPWDHGILQQSIDVKVKAYQGGTIVFCMIGPGKDFVILVNGERHRPNKYVHLIEFGHKLVNVTHADGSKIQVSPNPFMRKTYASTSRAVHDAFEKSLAASLRTHGLS